MGPSQLQKPAQTGLPPNHPGLLSTSPRSFCYLAKLRFKNQLRQAPALGVVPKDWRRLQPYRREGERGARPQGASARGALRVPRARETGRPLAHGGP